MGLAILLPVSKDLPLLFLSSLLFSISLTADFLKFIFNFLLVSFRFFSSLLFEDCLEVSRGFCYIVLSLFIFKQSAVCFNFFFKNTPLNNLWVTFPSS